MPPKTIEITGLERLRQALADLPDDARKELRAAMQQAAYLAQDQLAEYPPATAANRPGRTGPDGRPLGFYERGQGWWEPVMRRATLGEKPLKSAGALKKSRADKLFGGFDLGHAGVAGYRLRRTSEALGRSWTTKVSAGDHSLVGEVGTDTAYAPWVVDDERQARRMAQIGWQTVGQSLSAVSDDIQAIFDAAVDEILKGLTK